MRHYVCRNDDLTETRTLAFALEAYDDMPNDNNKSKYWFSVASCSALLIHPIHEVAAPLGGWGHPPWFVEDLRRAAMEYYVGLDVSLKSTHICVMDRDRQVVWRGSVDTQPSMIAERMKRWKGNLAKVGLETGSRHPGFTTG